MSKKPTTLSDHQSKAVKARWAKTSSQERSEYAKMMVEARIARRKSYIFTRDWSDRKKGEILTGAELGQGVIFRDLIASGTLVEQKVNNTVA